MSVTVETDHKPLEMILKKPLHQAPTRLQKTIMAIQKYPVTAFYCPGKELVVADMLSRAFLSEEACDLLADKFEKNVVHTPPIFEVKLERLKQETLKDPSLQELKRIVERGWPKIKAKVHITVSPY